VGAHGGVRCPARPPESRRAATVCWTGGRSSLPINRPAICFGPIPPLFCGPVGPGPLVIGPPRRSGRCETISPRPPARSISGAALERRCSGSAFRTVSISAKTGPGGSRPERPRDSWCWRLGRVVCQAVRAPSPFAAPTRGEQPPRPPSLRIRRWFHDEAIAKTPRLAGFGNQWRRFRRSVPP